MRAVELWVMMYCLNAAWQVPLLFGAAWVVVRLGWRAGAGFEHRVWGWALVLEALLPACPVRLREVAAAVAKVFEGSSGQAVHRARVTVVMGPGEVHGGLHVGPMWLGAMACLYACAVMWFALRLGVGLHRTVALRRRALQMLLSGEADRSWRRYARWFGVENAGVACSEEIAGPVTVGVRHRTLLLPVDVEQGMAPEDLDAAMAHEFAHMQRHDFAKNVAYEAVSLAVAFHPLLWLTRRRLAESREMVCDAMAAEAAEGKEKYARSLLRLASRVSDHTYAAAPQAIGIFDGDHFNSFERRIMRLTDGRMEFLLARRLAMAGAAVVIGFGVCASALALRVQVAASAAQNPQSAQSTQPPQNVRVQQAPDANTPTQMVVAVPRNGNVEPPATMVMDIPNVESTSADAATTRVRIMSDMEIKADGKSSGAGASTAAGQSVAAGPLSVSGGVMAGNILSKVNPAYPAAAKEAKVQGAVVIRAVIGTDGQFKSLRLVSGPEELRRSAWDAVKQWTYKPYLLNGTPVEVETTITVNYSLAE